MATRSLIFTREEALRRLSIAIDSFRGYPGPGQWRARPVYHELAPFVALEYVVSNDDQSPSAADILVEAPELPWEQFGGNQILAAAQVELSPYIERTQFVSVDWYTALGYISVLLEEDQFRSCDRDVGK
jgi:hypothetical protein